jgi:hypothetical protein
MFSDYYAYPRVETPYLDKLNSQLWDNYAHSKLSVSRIYLSVFSPEGYTLVPMTN